MRRAAVRMESAEAQEYESCQQNDIEVDRDEVKEELSFFPSTVSVSTGWHEPKFICGNQCRKGAFKFLGRTRSTSERTASR